jgi:hypothetical protein
MTELKSSTQLARYVSHKAVAIGAKQLPGVELTYVRLDGETPTESKVTYLKGYLPEPSQTIAKQFTKDYEFVIVKKQTPNPKNPSQPFWNLQEFKDKSEWVEKPKKQWGSGWAKPGTTSSKPFDDTGIKVGAARNQAIAFLSATKGKAFSLDDVDATAYEIVKRQAVQEENVRSGKFVAPDVSGHEMATQDLEPVQDDDIAF